MTQPKFRRTMLVLAAGGLLLGVSGVGVADTAKVRARGNDTWKKVHTYIEKGDRVKWSNPDSEMHDVTFYRASSWNVNLQPGDTARHKFRKKGTALYRCTIHSGIVDGACQGMCAFVHVL